MNNESVSSYSLADYSRVVKAFVDGQLSAVEFESVYLRMFKKDDAVRPEAHYNILNSLFGSVDAFCSDRSIRTVQDLDDEQLHNDAKAALSDLDSIVTVEGDGKAEGDRQ